MTTITPEMYGCDPTGQVDCTVMMQAFVDMFKDATFSQNHKCVGHGCYQVSDTIVLDSMHSPDITIGTRSIDRVHGWTNRSALPPGLMYVGPGGTGPEPENCKPIVRVKKVRNGHLSLVVHQDRKGNIRGSDPAQYVTGILISPDDVGQFGNIDSDYLHAYHCEYGTVWGLYGHDGGLIGNSASSREDCMESWTINLMRTGGCRHPMFVSCPTSDGTVIHKLETAAYLPSPSWDVDFGPSHYAVKMEHGGTLVIGNAFAAQLMAGDGRAWFVVPLADINSTTDTFTFAGHGMSDGWPVCVMIGNPPPVRPQRGVVYWVCGSTVDTFQLSETPGGPAMDISTDIPSDVRISSLSGDEFAYVVSDSGPRLHVNKLHAELLAMGVAKSTTGGSATRGWNYIGQITSSEHSRTCDGVAIDTTANLTGYNWGLVGAVRHRNLCSVENVNFSGMRGKDLFVKVGPSKSTLHAWHVTQSDDLTDLAEIGDAASVISRPLILQDGSEDWPSRGKLSVLGKSYQFTGVDTVANTLALPGTAIATGKSVLISTPGELPGGLTASTRYFVVTVSDGVYQLRNHGGDVIDLTSEGSGVFTLRECLDVCRFQPDPTDSCAIKLVLDGVGKYAITAGDYAVAFDLKAAIIRDIAGETSSTVGVQWLAASAGSAQCFGMFGAATWDANIQAFTISLACANSGNRGMAAICEAHVKGIRRQFPMASSGRMFGTQPTHAGFAWLPLE